MQLPEREVVQSEGFNTPVMDVGGNQATGV